MWEPPFRDRRDAGRQLGRLLDRYQDRPDLVVVPASRQAVPVAYEVAIKTGARLVDNVDDESLAGRTVVLVDDGLAADQLPAMIDGIRRHGPERIVAAVATAPAETCLTLADRADEAICVASAVAVDAYWDLTEKPEEHLDLLVREAAESTRRRRDSAR
jgi:predicted phosphoribosyltransferase